MIILVSLTITRPHTLSYTLSLELELSLFYFSERCIISFLLQIHVSREWNYDVIWESRDFYFYFIKIENEINWKNDSETAKKKISIIILNFLITNAKTKPSKHMLKSDKCIYQLLYKKHSNIRVASNTVLLWS